MTRTPPEEPARLPEYDALALQPFADARASSWHWRKVKAKHRLFALRADDVLLAGLRFEKPSGSLATADTAAGRFTFKRTGFFQVRMTARAAGGGEDLARFTPRLMGGGALELAAGPRFEWRGASMWSSRWIWAAEDGTELMRLTPRDLKVEADLEPAPAGLALPEAPLLVTFGFWLAVLHADEMTAVTAGAAAGG